MKGGLARQRFQAKQQRNKIISQLNQLHAAGFTDEDVRNAGNNAYRELIGGGAPSQTVVADGDTLSSIAQTNGTTETDILNANPDLKNIRTGMVINAPGSEQWRNQGYGQPPGGIGLPSNAALGQTTTNKRGENPNDVMRGRGYTPPQTPFNSGKNIIGNTLPQGQPFNPTGSSMYNYAQQLRQQQSARTFNQTGTSSTAYSPVNLSAPRTTNQYGGAVGQYGPALPPGYQSPALQTPRPVRGMPNYTQSSLAGLQAYRITDLHDAIQAGKTPTPAQLDYLVKRGLIEEQAPTYSGGGGGYRYKRYGGGRGGGGYGGGSRGSGGGSSQPRVPAFSTGSGMNGLINWRI